MNLSIILFIIHSFIVLLIAFLVVKENRSPVKSIAWIIVVFAAPFLGGLIYLLFGQDLRRVRLIHPKIYKRLRSYSKELKSTVVYHKHLDRELLRWKRTINLCKTPLLPIENSEIFTSGKDKFEALKYDIKNAKHHIHIEYYAFDNDELGNEIADLLIQQSLNGVAVRIIFDAVGSFSIKSKRKFLKKMKDAGIEIYPFMRVFLPAISFKINYRNHRKLVIIDANIGYIGGMNIADRYYNGNKLGIWRDTHFRITGLAVAELQGAFFQDWYLVSSQELKDKYFFPENPNLTSQDTSKPLMQLILGSPIGEWRTIENTILSLIYKAEKNIYIETPYFLPTPALEKALTSASLSGIDVQIIIPKNSDSLLVYSATASYIERLLKANVKVFLFKSGFLHSKLLTIDEQVASIGSVNMDFRSFEHNFESLGIIYDKELAKKLNTIFTLDRNNSDIVILDKWKKRKRWKKTIESLSRLFAPIL